MKAYAGQVYALLAKDLLLELRNRESITSVLVYALLVLVTFNFALDLRPEIMSAVGPGVLWVAVVLTGPVALARSFAEERDRGTLEMLIAAPVERSALFLARVAQAGLVMMVAQVALVPAFVALFNVQFAPAVLVPALVLGDVGLAAVGTIFAAIAAHTRAREVLLPILVFPIIVPLVIAVVQATGLALGSEVTQDRPWLGLLFAFDAVYLAIGVALFEYILEE